MFAIWHGMNHCPSMKTKIAMDSSGRLVLPKSVRQSLNTPPTALFEAEVLGNRLELTLTEPTSGTLRQRGKLLVVPKQGVAADAVEAVRQTRKDRQ
jgi:bifunctional DNA-binding transcriptional regulator/antitoxin component of YhaV-PrlF toxin-antitoxin module